MPKVKTSRERLQLVALIAGVLLMAVALRFDIDGDGAARFDMMQALVVHHQLPAGKYSLVQPIVATPLYILGTIVGQPVRLVQRFNLLIFAAMLFAVYRRLAPRTDTTLVGRWLLVMLACSMFLNHVRTFYTEVFSTAMVVVGLTYLATDATRVGSVALIVGVINSPPWLIPCALVSLKVAWDRRKTGMLFVPIVSALGIVAEAWIRRGSPFTTGYEGDHGFLTALPYSGLPGFSYPFLLGVLSLLFSFGKGLLFFAPGLTLVPERRLPDPLNRLYLLLLAFVAGLVLVYAKWWAWYGGWFWGPRFLLLASVPASLAVAAAATRGSRSIAWRCGALIVVAWSAWVGIDGAIFGIDALAKVGAANNYALESLTWYVPEFSPLWYAFIEHRPLAARDVLVIIYVVAVAAHVAWPLIAPRAAGVGRVLSDPPAQPGPEDPAYIAL